MQILIGVIVVAHGLIWMKIIAWFDRNLNKFRVRNTYRGSRSNFGTHFGVTCLCIFLDAYGKFLKRIHFKLSLSFIHTLDLHAYAGYSIQ